MRTLEVSGGLSFPVPPFVVLTILWSLISFRIIDQWHGQLDSCAPLAVTHQDMVWSSKVRSYCSALACPCFTRYRQILNPCIQLALTGHVSSLPTFSQSKLYSQVWDTDQELGHLVFSLLIRLVISLIQEYLNPKDFSWFIFMVKDIKSRLILILWLKYTTTYLSPTGQIQKISDITIFLYWLCPHQMLKLSVGIKNLQVVSKSRHISFVLLCRNIKFNTQRSKTTMECLHDEMYVFLRFQPHSIFVTVKISVFIRVAFWNISDLLVTLFLWHCLQAPEHWLLALTKCACSSLSTALSSLYQ